MTWTRLDNMEGVNTNGETQCRDLDNINDVKKDNFQDY